jgi:formylglycine-generating enzyme required for sulfatase activity
MEKNNSGKKVLSLILMIMAILMSMTLYSCDYKTGQYQFDPEIESEIESQLESIYGEQYGESGGEHTISISQFGIIIDGQLVSVSSDQLGAVSDEQLASVIGGQPGTTVDGQPASASGGQPGTTADGQPTSASGGQPGTTAGGQPTSASGGQPGTTAGGQSVSVSSGQPGAATGGQPGTTAGGQSVSVSGGQPGTTAGGQPVLPQVTQGGNAETAVQRQPVAVRVTPPVPDTMAMIIGGDFYMSDPLTNDEEEDEENIKDEPKHLVTIRSFYIGKYEVTQREYQEVMRHNPSYFKGQNLPVENINWFDAIEYCNRLSLRVGLAPAYTITGRGKNRVVTWDLEAEGYRLPTAAEWEYACRAGTTTSFNTGNKISRTLANYWGSGTKPVGSYAPNGWGLYDMHGNVAEWCWDLFGNYDSESSDETHRVFRGGNWLNTTMRLRARFIDHFYPNHRNSGIGLRVVRNTY